MNKTMLLLLISFSLCASELPVPYNSEPEQSRPMPAAEAAAKMRLPPGSSDFQFFENKIRPILAEHCYSCHSARAEKIKGGLRLDTKEGLLKGGNDGPVVVPGEPEKSLLITAVSYADPELQMPPPKSGTRKLPDGVIADLTKWVKLGAPFPDLLAESSRIGPSESRHWAFKPITNPPVPRVRNTSWPRSAIDYFILTKLEEKNLQPAPAAAKRNLIRRATFDLNGLPPTPAEVDAFLADTSPDAFSRVVDRLLASPRYGERWARHWLDLARYADSNGMDENLAYASAFRYRDYVVAAFNQDKPYDRFIREQLAGDLLPPAAPDADPSEQLVATGFLSIGPKMLAEDDPMKMEMDIIDEQLDTTCRVFMGLTVGCARCHDHKYDPIPTADYYAMAGMLKSTKTMDNFKVVARWQERPLGPPSAVEKWQTQKKIIDEKNQRVNALVAEGNTNLLREARSFVGDYLLAATEKRALDRWLKETKPLGQNLQAKAVHNFIVVEAEDFQRQENLITTTNGYGEGIGIIYGPGGKLNAAEYDVPVATAGFYRMEIRYAAAESRPVKVSINGKLANSDAAGKVTGSWNPDSQMWEVAGLIRLDSGTNTVRIERADCIPHIDKLLFAPVEESEAGKIAGLARAIPETSRLIPEFVAQWTKYLEKTERATNSVLSVWHEFLASGKLRAAEGTNANEPKNAPFPLTPALSIGEREKRSPLSDKSPATLGLPIAPRESGNAEKDPRSLDSKRAAERNPRSLDSQPAAESGSLSPRERAGVRGNRVSDSPAASVLFRGGSPRSLSELAGRYAEQFSQADQAWQQLKSSTHGAKTEKLAESIQESFRQVLYDAQGPFAVPKNSESYFPSKQVAELKKSREYLKELEQALPALPEAMSVSDAPPVNLRIHKRGSHLSLGEEAPRGFLRIIDNPPHSLVGSRQSGRLEMADWIANPRNPLTARVVVNRIWLWHFGEGLVRSPDNFGKLGESPTHPEFLDWLASRFIANGWSIKSMHRLIMNSAVYQQSVVAADVRRLSSKSEIRNAKSEIEVSLLTSAATIDPENRLWSHSNRRRLEVEAIRDAILAVSGSLDLAAGGSLLPTKNRAYVTGTGSNLDTTAYDSSRRALYLPVVRSALYDLFQVFDFADPSVLNGRRDQTTVAPQALFMLNSRFVARETKALAAALLAEKTLDDTARVAKLYSVAYARPPSDRERAAALHYVEHYAGQLPADTGASTDRKLRAWQSLCRGVLAANEFIYLD